MPFVFIVLHVTINFQEVTVFMVDTVNIFNQLNRKTVCDVCV